MSETVVKGIMTPLRQADRYLEIGFAFPACIVVGLMLGYGLDRHFHTHFLYIVGLLLGIAAGFVQLIRLTRKPPPDAP
jgi:F0F1-type ATP synthase assembly protein I